MLRFRSPTYRIICVGVNHAPRADVLRFAEKDASDIARIMSGQVGPVDPENVMVLHGATKARLRAALTQVRADKPDFLLFYFSGHGSTAGLSLRDGLFSYDELSRWLQAIGATASATVLDTCYSGAFIKEGRTVLGAVDVDVLQLLAEATPGNRVICSSSADRKSSEGGGVRNGHMTAALIDAILQAPGDLRGKDGGWITARRLFSRIQKTLTHRGQCPVAYGLEGDFPFARDHQFIYGDAELAGLDISGQHVLVSLAVTDRRGIPTIVSAEASNRQGRRLFHRAFTVFATDVIDVANVSFRFDTSAVAMDPASQIHLLMRNTAPVIWRVALLDARGRHLDVAEQQSWYSNGAPRRPFGGGGILPGRIVLRRRVRIESSPVRCAILP